MLAHGPVGLHLASRVLGIPEEQVIALAREGKIILTHWCLEEVNKRGNSPRSPGQAGGEGEDICWSFDRQSVEAYHENFRDKETEDVRFKVEECLAALNKMRIEMMEMCERVRKGQDKTDETLGRLEAGQSDILEAVLKKK
jgi:hypothetical protein